MPTACTPPRSHGALAAVPFSSAFLAAPAPARPLPDRQAYIGCLMASLVPPVRPFYRCSWLPARFSGAHAPALRRATASQTCLSDQCCACAQDNAGADSALTLPISYPDVFPFCGLPALCRISVDAHVSGCSPRSVRVCASACKCLCIRLFVLLLVAVLVRLLTPEHQGRAEHAHA
jgi:hypothetical protein